MNLGAQILEAAILASKKNYHSNRSRRRALDREINRLSSLQLPVDSLDEESS
jgi:hypothetical protein